MSASNIYRVWIPDIDRVIISRDVRVDEGVKFKPSELKNKVPLSQRKIMTILENDLDENEIEELVKEKEAESRIEIMIDDEEPVEKAIPTPQDSMFGSPAPLASNSSPNTSL